MPSCPAWSTPGSDAPVSPPEEAVGFGGVHESMRSSHGSVTGAWAKSTIMSSARRLKSAARLGIGGVDALDETGAVMPRTIRAFAGRCKTRNRNALPLPRATPGTGLRLPSVRAGSPPPRMSGAGHPRRSGRRGWTRGSGGPRFEFPHVPGPAGRAVGDGHRHHHAAHAPVGREALGPVQHPAAGRALLRPSPTRGRTRRASDRDFARRCRAHGRRWRGGPRAAESRTRCTAARCP
jgi:hypothetical protein